MVIIGEDADANEEDGSANRPSRWNLKRCANHRPCSAHSVLHEKGVEGVDQFPFVKQSRHATAVVVGGGASSCAAAGRIRASPGRFAKFNNKLSLMHKFDLCSRLFGGILNLAETLPAHLTKYLVQCYKSENSEILHVVFDLPNRGKKVIYVVNKDATRTFRETFNIIGNSHPKISTWCNIIQDMKGKVDDTFSITWLAVAFNTFLPPTTTLKLSPNNCAIRANAWDRNIIAKVIKKDMVSPSVFGKLQLSSLALFNNAFYEYRGTKQTPLFGGLLQADAFKKAKITKVVHDLCKSVFEQVGNFIEAVVKIDEEEPYIDPYIEKTSLETDAEINLEKEATSGADLAATAMKREPNTSEHGRVVHVEPTTILEVQQFKGKTIVSALPPNPVKQKKIIKFDKGTKREEATKGEKIPTTTTIVPTDVRREPNTTEQGTTVHVDPTTIPEVQQIKGKTPLSALPPEPVKQKKIVKFANDTKGEEATKGTLGHQPIRISSSYTYHGDGYCDAPTFDLGLDDITEPIGSPQTGEANLVVIDEDVLDSLRVKEACGAADVGKGLVHQTNVALPDGYHTPICGEAEAGTSSCSRPVVARRHMRVIRRGACQRSPFIDYKRNKTFNNNEAINKLYASLVYWVRYHLGANDDATQYHPLSCTPKQSRLRTTGLVVAYSHLFV
ncbi:hypothetical protein ZWY2020_046593 [Hordeum vulgare]|nr:hypothetical protein ZWY2020_046593 [Hordeum vulgare]